MLTRILVSCLLINSVVSNPIIIKTGMAQNREQEQEGGVYTVLGRKGISSYIGDLGFNKDNQGKFVSAEDSGKFLQENSGSNNHLDAKDVNEESAYRNDGGSLQNLDEKTGHKKGHHNSGFKNTYHKEESGSKSSYYDDSDDEGGRLLQDRRNGFYSDGSSRKNLGSYRNDGKYINGNARNGYYQNKGLFDKGYGNQRKYNEERFNDDRLLNSQDNRGNKFGESAKYLEENYMEPYYRHEDDYYYHPHGNLQHYVPPKRTIAIYEDPRYERDYTGYNQDVLLEIRPPLHRSQRTHYNHDYYY